MKGLSKYPKYPIIFLPLNFFIIKEIEHCLKVEQTLYEKYVKFMISGITAPSAREKAVTCSSAVPVE